MTARSFREILKDLARRDPVVRDGLAPGQCTLCLCYERHAATCPWRIAQRIDGGAITRWRRTQHATREEPRV